MAALLKDRKKQPSEPAVRVAETSVAKFSEEIKVLVRDIPDRVASELGNDPRMRRMRRRCRLNPMMFEELFRHPMFRKSPGQAGLPVLMMTSALRDDYPWLYELGLQLYRAIESGNPRAIDRASRTIVNTIEMTHYGPFMREMIGGPEDEKPMMALNYLVHSIDLYFPTPKRAGKGEAKSPEKGE